MIGYKSLLVGTRAGLFGEAIKTWLKAQDQQLLVTVRTPIPTHLCEMYHKCASCMTQAGLPGYGDWSTLLQVQDQNLPRSDYTSHPLNLHPSTRRLVTYIHYLSRFEFDLLNVCTK